MIAPVLEVRGLTTAIASQGRTVRVVDGVDLHVGPREIVALAGESGSGKTLLLRSILGLAPERPGVVGGQVVLRVGAHELRPYEDLGAYLEEDRVDAAEIPRVNRRFFGILERRMKRIRGSGVGLVLQNGGAALDPLMTVSAQLEAAVRDGGTHARNGSPTPDLADRLPPDAVRETALSWLERLEFSDPKAVASAYPHELSGGMAQRVMLGVVLARRPALLLLDEVTTGLDVTLQAAILRLLRQLHEEIGFAALLVTHDLAMARGISDRTVIMRSGRLIQAAPTSALFDGRVALAPYTSRLLKNGRFGPLNRPELVEDLLLRSEASEVPRIAADGVVRTFQSQRLGWFKRATSRAVRSVSMSLHPGECVAIVGESGSGKTTLAHLLLGLIRPDAGAVRFDGMDLDEMNADERAAFVRRRAILFQNPYTSLNPEMTATDVVAETLERLPGASNGEPKRRAVALLDEVGLGPRRDARVRELSGGERRRLGLLKVLQSEASLLVLDEPTAGLDTILRQTVAEMVWASRVRQPERTVLLIGHDLGFVSRVADRIVVMYRGAVVEDMPVTAFMSERARHHPYTLRLWDSARYVAGEADSHIRLEEPATDDPASSLLTEHAPGCLYRPRCATYRSAPVRFACCEEVRPALKRVALRRSIACHGVGHEDIPS